MYFITCFSKCEKDEKGWFDGGAARVFGFVETLEEAERALNENWCDMFEYLYTYAVVEKMEPGIHPECEEEYWFEWNQEKEGFFRIEKPEATEGVCNHALG